MLDCSPMPRPVRPLAALAIAALLFAAPARAQTMDVSDLRVLIRDVHDEKKAAEAVAKLRGYLASRPDSNFIPVLRVSIVTGLIVSHAPPKQIAAAADTAERLLSNDPQTRFRFYTQVSQTLVQNNAELPLAIRYLHQAIAILPDDPRAASMRSLLTGTLGQAQLMSGQLDSAVVSLGNALDQHPDSLQVLLSLGDAWQKKGNADRAIDAYVRALACYPSTDTTAAAPLAIASRSTASATCARPTPGRSRVSTARRFRSPISAARSSCSTSGARGAGRAARSCRSSSVCTSAIASAASCSSA
jgi:tetratricopeptide (TPR) repeat protein